MLECSNYKRTFKNKVIKEREKEKMNKYGLLKNEKMGDYEKEQGRASYRTLVNYYIGDIVLCNNIVNEDESVFYNMEQEDTTKYYNENGEEISEEEYYNDDNAYTENEEQEIFQYYLCNLGQWEREQAQKHGLILSYSDKLDCDVLCVDHWGTSWDYVLTDTPLFDTWEELEKYEKDGE